jgi:ribosome-associated protein
MARRTIWGPTPSALTTGLWYNSINTTSEFLRLEGIEVARRAVEIASDKQANNIVLLDVRGICSFADYFVICDGDSARQLRTILEEIEYILKKDKVLPHHHEGTVDSGWLLLDYGDVIVHIFGNAERDFYKLDELWHEARTIIKIQ